MSTTDISGVSDGCTGAQNVICAEATGVNESDKDVPQEDRNQPTNSTQTQQSSDSGGGCMEVFKMIIQVAAAVVSVVWPAAAPVAMAIAGAVSKIDTGAEAGGSSDSSVNMANIGNYNDEARERLEDWGDYPVNSPNFNVG